MAGIQRRSGGMRQYSVSWTPTEAAIVEGIQAVNGWSQSMIVRDLIHRGAADFWREHELLERLRPNPPALRPEPAEVAS